MKKFFCMMTLLCACVGLYAGAKKDSVQEDSVVQILEEDFKKPGYGEGGGSGAANLPFDAPPFTEDMIGDTTVPIGEVSQRPFETLTGKVKVSDGKPFVSAGLFSKVALSFPKRSDEHALTTQDILDRRGKTVTLEGWYSEDRKSFVVFSLVE